MILVGRFPVKLQNTAAASSPESAAKASQPAGEVTVTS